MQTFSASLAPQRLDLTINPWSFSFLTVNLGRSADPGVERQILDDVGSYGRQLGRIGDALAVLAARVDRSKLTKKQRKALQALDDQLELIRLIKKERRAR